MLRKSIWIVGALIILTPILAGVGLWFASNQLLFPSFKGSTNGPFVCRAESEKYWGAGCGSLRETRQFKFDEVQVPSVNGYDLPGWIIKAEDNGMGQARGAIMLVPPGGSDKRDDTRYIQFYLSQRLDVMAIDPGCHGEAPCPVPGLTYGERESRDVFSAYLYLTERYDKVYAMGSSVGAASILISLPEMPGLVGVIAENPFTSYHRLIKEAPESKSMPSWATDLLLGLAMLRGRFDGLQSAKNSLRLAKTTPVFFIHSKEDKVVSFQQTEELYELYNGPKSVWFAEKGDHAMIWDVDHTEYERRVADFLDSTK